jgi:hypothetical protein
MTALPLPAETYAVARLIGGVPTFFVAFGATTPDLRTVPLITTGEPDKARAYDSRVVAELIVGLLDVIDSIGTGQPQKAWIVMPLPEEWL